MTRKTIINKSLANDCCHCVGFCKDGVIKDKSIYGFTHSITIELDPSLDTAMAFAPRLRSTFPIAIRKCGRGGTYPDARSRSLPTPSQSTRHREGNIPCLSRCRSMRFRKVASQHLWGRVKRSDCVLVREG